MEYSTTSWNMHHDDENDQGIRQAPSSLLETVLTRLAPATEHSAVECSIASLLQDLKSQDWSVRAAAIDALAEWSDQVPLEPLLSVLHDDDGSVRATALRVLARQGHRVPGEQLLAALYDPEWHVRETAVFALGRQIPIQVLLAILHDEDTYVRAAARQILEEFHPETAVEQPAKQQELLTGASNLAPVLVDGQQSGHVGSTRGIYQLVRAVLSRTHSTIHSALARQRQAGGNEMQEPQASTEFSSGESNSPARWPVEPQRGRVKRRPLLRLIEGGIAVLIVLGIVLSWAALTHNLHSSKQETPATPQVNQGTPIFTDRFTHFPGGAWSWSADSRYLSYQREGKNIAALDITTRRSSEYPVLGLFTPTPGGGAGNAGWGSNGRYLVLVGSETVSKTAIIQVWDTIPGSNLFTHSFPAQITNASNDSNFTLPNPTLSDNDKQIAIINVDGTIEVWDVITGKRITTCQGNAGNFETIGPLQWFPDGHHLLFSNTNGMLQVCDARTGQKTFVINDPATQFFDAELSPDGKYISLATGSASSGKQGTPTTITILDAATGKPIQVYRQNGLDWQLGTEVVQWLPDSLHVVTRYVHSTQSEVRVWNILTDQAILDTFFALHGREEVSANGKYIAMDGLNGGRVEIWDVLAGHRIATIQGNVTTQLYSLWEMNSRYLVSLQGDDLYLWDVLTGHLAFIKHLPAHDTHELLWSPDGKYLATESFPQSWSNNSSYPNETILQVWQMF